MAIIYGIDSRRVSSHSLRIGGPMAMAATGISKYEIQKMDSGNHMYSSTTPEIQPGCSSGRVAH